MTEYRSSAVAIRLIALNYLTAGRTTIINSRNHLNNRCRTVINNNFNHQPGAEKMLNRRRYIRFVVLSLGDSEDKYCGRIESNGNHPGATFGETNYFRDHRKNKTALRWESRKPANYGCAEETPLGRTRP